MWNSSDSIESVKDAFAEALQSIPEFANLGILEKGHVIDKNFKSMMKDLLDDSEMQPGEDYEIDLRSTEPGADFVIKSKEANDIIQNLLNGRITLRKEHTKMMPSGNSYKVRAHFMKVPGKF